MLFADVLMAWYMPNFPWDRREFPGMLYGSQKVIAWTIKIKDDTADTGHGVPEASGKADEQAWGAAPAFWTGWCGWWTWGRAAAFLGSWLTMVMRGGVGWDGWGTGCKGRVRLPIGEEVAKVSPKGDGVTGGKKLWWVIGEGSELGLKVFWEEGGIAF